MDEERGISIGAPPVDDEQVLLNFYSVSSWTELDRQGVHNPVLRAHIELGLVNLTEIRNRAIRERALQAENKSEFIRREALRRGLSPNMVRLIVYCQT